MHCSKCGSEFVFKDRVQFRDRCIACDAPVHACVNCSFYSPGAYNDCREPKAERVVEKARENRCEYFRPAENTASAPGKEDDVLKKKFDDLFS